MNLLGLNILLAICWAALMSNFSPISLITGFAIGYGILWLLQPLLGGRKPYVLRVYHWVRLIVMFHYELVVSSLAVIWDVLTPTHRSHPDIVEMPLDVKSDTGILLVTNLISLTPGTLCIDVSDDRSTLYVHAMFAQNPDDVRKTLKTGMERWVKEALE